MKKVTVVANADGITVNGVKVNGYKLFKDQYNRTVLITTSTRNASKWINSGRIVAFDSETNEVLKTDNLGGGWHKLGPSIKAEVLDEDVE